MAFIQDEAAELIEQFIRREFRVPEADNSFRRDTHLFDAGFIDSMGVVELISFIESTFGVRIPDEDLFSESFTTVNGISAVVQNLTNGGRCDRRSSL